MNTNTTKAIADSIKDSSTFQKYERKRPSKRLLETALDTLPDEHSERHNKHSCVKQAWRGIRDMKRNWSTEQ